MVKVTKIILENGDNKNCIIIPDGYVIDEVNSSDIEIKFVKERVVVENNNNRVEAYHFLDDETYIVKHKVCSLQKKGYYSPTVPIAKHVQAINRISFILKYDDRFGGMIEPVEWTKPYKKYVINHIGNNYEIRAAIYNKFLLAFHTREQAELFFKEYSNLIKDYYCY